MDDYLGKNSLKPINFCCTLLLKRYDANSFTLRNIPAKIKIVVFYAIDTVHFYVTNVSEKAPSPKVQAAC
jgi:hypothetical protein